MRLRTALAFAALTTSTLASSLAGCGRLNYEHPPVEDDGGPSRFDSGVDSGPTNVCTGDSDCGAGQRCVDRRCIDDWWEPTWGARIRLDLDRYSPSEDLFNFPLMVMLNTSRFDAGEAQPDLADLRFVHDSGTPLEHEIEIGSGGDIIAWVSIPHMIAGENPTIWLYFGNARALPRSGSAFDDSYRGVYHMATNANDASPAGNHGWASGASWTTGPMGHAADFNASVGDYIEVPDDPRLHWEASELTASGWVRLRAYSDSYSTLVARQRVEEDALNDFFLAVGPGGEARAEVNPGVLARIGSGPERIALGTWVHLALVCDNLDVRLYIDGAEVASGTLSAPMTSSARPIYIGADRNGAGTVDSGFTEGSIDEVRVEAVARSAAQIAADFVSGSDRWITYGPVEYY